MSNRLICYQFLSHHIDKLFIFLTTKVCDEFQVIYTSSETLYLQKNSYRPLSLNLLVQLWNVNGKVLQYIWSDERLWLKYIAKPNHQNHLEWKGKTVQSEKCFYIFQKGKFRRWKMNLNKHQESAYLFKTQLVLIVPAPSLQLYFFVSLNIILLLQASPLFIITISFSSFSKIFILKVGKMVMEKNLKNFISLVWIQI